jgi:aspartyl-tRNA(Asn)/glutamyl-tRNA(Gln) amidotransferase subunit B
MTEEIYNKYETVIGLEVHIQLSTKTKAYCADHYEYGGLPNHQVSPISLGHPGTLPKFNKKVVEYAIRLGLATESTIAEKMDFARKNYFYADLPKGYQITQDKTPICTEGKIDIRVGDETKTINLTRIHIEEDAGKSIHDIDPFDTLIDINRAGVPLCEIVSEPEMRSGEEAYQYLAEVRKLVRYLDVCDGNMEEGSMRCDANVSVRLKGATELGNRSEVKNMNSLRNVQRAIEHEAKRQIEIIENGGVIAQDTRSFDAVSGTTTSMRSKEMAHDYRFFPEPDLQPLFVTRNDVELVKNEMPPLPNFLYKKYTEELGLTPYDAANLTEEKGIALYFEEIIKHTKSHKSAANRVMGDVKSYLNERALDIEEFKVKPEAIAKLIALVEADKVNNTVASMKIFPAMTEDENLDPEKFALENNLIQDSSEDDIIQIARDALAVFPEKVEAYKAGNKNLLGLFMGEFMKKAKGKANPKKANEIIRNLLDNE